MNRLSRCLLGLAVAGMALELGSCRRANHEAVYPTTGKVFYLGKPAEWAQVTLVPLNDDDPKKPRPGAQVRSDGTFRLSTYASYDGAPAGRYAVTIVYPSPAKKAEDENVGPDLLRGRYANPKTTPFTVEIKEGVNELDPFDLRP